MKLNKMISVIDTHTAGEAARLVTAGIPKIPGKDMVEKKQYFIDHLDDVRKSVMFEPRGHQDMFGAFLLPPTKEEADFGLVFMDTGGYLNMCGHNTIAAVTAAVETGMVDVEEGATEKEVVVETPAGLIYATAKLKDNGAKVKEVSFRNVESFLYKRDVELDVEGIGHIKFDISFGGSFFCILSADQLGLEVKPENASKLKEVPENEEAKNDDVVNINFEGFVDGVAFDGGKAEGYDLTLGSHSFIDTFEDQIVGHKKNDEFDVNVKFPEAYHAENLKGKPALFKVKVNSITRKEEAESNDDLAKELGFESVDDMRAKTRENITKREEARVENEFKNKIIEKVVDGTNVKAPKALVDREIEFQINRFAQQLQMQGINLSQYFQMTGQTIDKMREDSREMAEKSVKTELVLSEISKVENITVTDEEVDNEFEVMATMYGMDKESMLNEVKKSGNYQRFADEAKYRLVNKKTIDLLVKETKVR